MYKNMNKGMKSIENSSPLYQTYTPTVIKNEPKSEPSYKRQVVHARAQTPPGEPVARPEKKAYCILFNPLFKKNFRGQNHPREVD